MVGIGKKEKVLAVLLGKKWGKNKLGEGGGYYRFQTGLNLAGNLNIEPGEIAPSFILILFV